MYQSGFIVLSSGVGTQDLPGEVALSNANGDLGSTYVVNANFSNGALNPGFITTQVTPARVAGHPWVVSVAVVDANGETVTGCNDTVVYSYDDGN